MDIIENKKLDLTNPRTLVNNFYELLLARGLYEMQLTPWYDSFSNDKMLINSSEDLANDTDNTLKEIFNFLNIPNMKIQDTTRKNKRQYPPMKKETRQSLIEFYKPYNEKLYALVNIKFVWD